MKIKLLGLFILFGIFAQAQDELLDTSEISSLLEQFQMETMLTQYYDSIDQTFNYQTGPIEIGGGVAKLNVPLGFKYISGKDADRVLTELWGNPPADPGDESLGMLFPEDGSPMKDSTYAVNITYSKDGYIDDKDAKDLDYDELLETMQEEIEDGNEYRQELGYGTMHLIGWASAPYYDEESKKIHWAKELNFNEMDQNTLNYNIRILGRKGYLELNAIGDMNILDEVKLNIDPILAGVNFNKGYTYGEFDPKVDKIAAYGIGGLIAGKVLAKAGLLAKLGIVLAKFWKIIALAVVGFFAGFRKLFGKKDPEA